MIAELKRSHPPGSIRQYVISGAESEQDVIQCRPARRQVGGVQGGGFGAMIRA